MTAKTPESPVVNLSMLFQLLNGLALVLWLLLIFLPRTRLTRILIFDGWGLALLALVYGLLFLFPATEPQGDFFSLAGVQSLFRNKSVLLAGWVHYLIFDLFVGSHEQREFERLDTAQWIRLPILALTFMLGPLGYLGFWLYRFRVKANQS
jgi:hypothetical protein